MALEQGATGNRVGAKSWACATVGDDPRNSTRPLLGGLSRHLNTIFLYTGLYAGSAALLKLAGFVFFLWLARTLSVEDYGSWGLLYALQSAVASFGAAGISEGVVGMLKTHRSAEDRGRLFASANAVFLVTLGLSVLLAFLLYAVFLRRWGDSQTTALYVAASGGLLAYSSMQAQIVRLEEQHLASLCFNFLVPLGGLIGSFLAFVAVRTVQSFFVGSALGLAACLAGARIVGLGFYRVADSAAVFTPILRRAAPFIAVMMLGWLGGYGNNYVIKYFFCSEQVAKFTLVFMLASIMQLVATAMNQAWSPRFYRLVHELPFAQLEKCNRDFFRGQAVVLGLTGGLLIAIYPAFVKLLGGNLAHYQSLAPELALLVLAYVTLLPWWQCQNYFLAHDTGPAVMRILVITSLMGVLALVTLILIFGPLGIYIGFFVQMLLRSLGAVLVSKARWRVSIAWDGLIAGMMLTSIGFLFSRPGLGH